jgi:hypothetical protein
VHKDLKLVEVLANIRIISIGNSYLISHWSDFISLIYYMQEHVEGGYYDLGKGRDTSKRGNGTITAIAVTGDGNQNI